MDLGLDGKVALITGGSSGIGLAIAHKLAGEGAKVAIAGRERTKLDAAAVEIPGTLGFAADLRDAAEVARLVDDVIAAFGRIDIVVSNAGTHLAGRLEDVETGDLVRHIETKVLGPWELAKRVVPVCANKAAADLSSSSARPAKSHRPTRSRRPSPTRRSTLS